MGRYIEKASAVNIQDLAEYVDNHLLPSGKVGSSLKKKDLLNI
jgi:hypothetical protein